MQSPEDHDHLPKQEEVRRHVEELRRQLHDYKAKSWRLTVDKTELRGRYLLFEALNTASVGPGLCLAPNARMGDGYFNLVLVREDERQLIERYLTARLHKGRNTAFPLNARKFRKLRIRCRKTPIHLDSKLPWEKSSEIPNQFMFKLDVRPAALLVLAKHLHAWR